LSTECSSLTMKLANCRTTHLSFPLSWYLDQEFNYGPWSVTLSAYR